VEVVVTVDTRPLIRVIRKAEDAARERARRERQWARDR
jgi:hypothetical protein